MIKNDIVLDKDKDFRIGFGGGCMILCCNKCKRDISAKEIDFPGTKEQQEPIRKMFEEKKKEHQCDSSSQ